jgi:acyl-CoA thioester hydrolase
MPKTHKMRFRIYYEDTDAAGVVYHANYLKFAERARTEWLRAKGFSQSELKKRRGLVFAVRHIASDFLAPAMLDDEITVETRLQETGKVRMTLQQIFKRGKTELARLTVIIVTVKNWKAVRLPKDIV